MCVARDACNTLNSKIEWLQLEFTIFTICQSRLLKIRHNETSQATVDVQTDFIGCSQLAKGDNIVLIAVREIDGRPNQL